jgi:hypothetical protein
MCEAVGEFLIRPLLQSIEDDIARTEEHIDNLRCFSAVLWLQTPPRRYFTDLHSLATANPAAALSYILPLLSLRLKRLVEPGGQSPTLTKFVLVLCELTRLLPSSTLSEDAITSVKQIAGLQIRSRKLGAAQHLIISAVDGAVRAAVIAGANPIPVIFAPAAAPTASDAISTLSTLHHIAVTDATVRSVFSAFPNFLASVAVEQRLPLASAMYGFMTKCFTLEPTIYLDFLQEGINLFQLSVDIILEWKSTPDAESACLLAALLPFCTTTLAAFAKSPKKHPYSAVLQVLGEYDKKKEAGRFYLACGVLEIASALALKENLGDAFLALSEFWQKTQPKFEQFFFDNRTKKDGHVKARLLTEWLPRYAALEYAQSGSIYGPAVKCLSTAPAKPSGWDAVLAFLAHVYSGYPRATDETVIRNKFFPEVLMYLGNVLATVLKDRNLDLSPNRILGLLASDNCGFSRYGMLTFAGAQKRRHEPHAAMQGCRRAARSLGSLAAICGQLLEFACDAGNADIGPIATFLRFFWTVDEKWAAQLRLVSHRDLQNFVAEIAQAFRVQTQRAVLIAAPAASLLPGLLLWFLKWARFALKATLKPDSQRFEGAVAEALLTAGLVLQAVAGRPWFEEVSENLQRILRLYKIALPPAELSDDGKAMERAAGLLVQCWLGYVKKQLANEGRPDSAITVAGKLPAKLRPSRQRIASTTQFLVRVVRSQANAAGPGGAPLEDEFWGACFVYLTNSEFADDLFTGSFAAIAPESHEKFVGALAATVGVVRQVERPTFWVNIMDTAASALSPDNVQNPTLYAGVENLLPAFVAVAEATEPAGPFFGSLQRLLDRFVGGPKAEIIWHVVCPAIFRIALRLEAAEALPLLKTGADCLTDFSFDRSVTNRHIDSVTCSSDAVRAISAILQAANAILAKFSGVQVVTQIQQALDRVFAANASIAWPLFVQFASTNNLILRVLLLDSLCLFFNHTFAPSRVPQLTNSVVLTKFGNRRATSLAAAQIRWCLAREKSDRPGGPYTEAHFLNRSRYL